MASLGALVVVRIRHAAFAETEVPPCARRGIEHSNMCSSSSYNDESTATGIRGYVAARQKNGCSPIKVIYIDKPGCDGATVCRAYRPVR